MRALLVLAAVLAAAAGQEGLTVVITPWSFVPEPQPIYDGIDGVGG